VSRLVVEALRLEISSLRTLKEHTGFGRNFLPSQRFALPLPLAKLDFPC
jgi:hypothetical protein